MKRIACLLILISCIVYPNVWSQKNLGIEVKSKIGYLVPHRSVMHHLVQGHAHSIEISGVFEASGQKEWHKLYNFPRMGVTASLNTYGNAAVLGHSVGLYSFIELPLIKGEKWSLNAKKGAGFAYVTKVFDQQTNPKNNAISTHLNCTVVLGLQLNRTWKQSNVALGIEMTHLSNGATRLPNLGLNLPYLSLGYTRYIEPLRQISNEFKTVEYSNWKLLLSGIISTRQILPTGGRNYFISSMGIYTQKQFKPKVKAEFGLDVFYNQSHYDFFTDLTPSTVDVFQLGIYAGYLLPLDRLEFLLGMGYYFRNKINPEGPIYHRFGARYRINERLSANITIKAHWGKADYFEYGLIYTLKR